LSKPGWFFKSGGPALLFENPKVESHPLLWNPTSSPPPSGGIVLALGATSPTTSAGGSATWLEQGCSRPQGLPRKRCAALSLKKLKSIDRLAAPRGSPQAGARCREGGPDGDRGRTWAALAGPDLRAPASRRRRSSTLPAVITTDTRAGAGRNPSACTDLAGARPAPTAIKQLGPIHKDGPWRNYLLADGKPKVAVAASGLDPVTAFTRPGCQRRAARRHVDDVHGWPGFLARRARFELLQAKKGGPFGPRGSRPWEIPCSRATIAKRTS